MGGTRPPLRSPAKNHSSPRQSPVSNRTRSKTAPRTLRSPLYKTHSSPPSNKRSSSRSVTYGNPNNNEPTTKTRQKTKSASKTHIPTRNSSSSIQSPTIYMHLQDLASSDPSEVPSTPTTTPQTNNGPEDNSESSSPPVPPHNPHLSQDSSISSLTISQPHFPDSDEDTQQNSFRRITRSLNGIQTKTTDRLNISRSTPRRSSPSSSPHNDSNQSSPLPSSVRSTISSSKTPSRSRSNRHRNSPTESHTPPPLRPTTLPKRPTKTLQSCDLMGLLPDMTLTDIPMDKIPILLLFEDTIKTIPNHLVPIIRCTYSQTITDLLNARTRQDLQEELKAWKQLFLLPVATLSSHNPRTIRQRAQMILKRDWSSLTIKSFFAKAPRPRAIMENTNLDLNSEDPFIEIDNNTNFKRIQQAATAGDLSKAFQLLSAEFKLLKPTDTVYSKLDEKFPKEAFPNAHENQALASTEEPPVNNNEQHQPETANNNNTPQATNVQNTPDYCYMLDRNSKYTL